MWQPVSKKWNFHDQSFVSDAHDPDRRTGPWHGHRWFAYDLIAWGRPDTVVELGSHYGVSFFAFCQAVRDGNLRTHLTAIDTWEGDPDAGEYGPEVKQTFDEILTSEFSDVPVTVLQSLFDDALDKIDDESIDLLHIDGFHSYDAVRHDWETWEPKLAPNGIVLFHDVAETSGYGSSKYWNEIRTAHPSHTFFHSFGLGVLAPKGTKKLEALFKDQSDPVLSYYEHRAGHYLNAIAAKDLESMVIARDEAIKAIEARLDATIESTQAQTALIDDRDALIGKLEERIQDFTGAFAAQTQLIDEFRAAVDAQSTLIDERDALIVEMEGRLTSLQDSIASELVGSDELQSQLLHGADIERMLRHDSDEKQKLIDHLQHQLLIRTPKFAAKRVARKSLDALPPSARFALRDGVENVVQIGRKRKLTAKVADRVERLATKAGVPLALESNARDRGVRAAFDATYYEARYPGVSDWGDSFEHYCFIGWKRGYRPHPLFDPSWYLHTYPDVAEMKMEPFRHFVDHGWSEGRHLDGPLDGQWFAKTEDLHTDAFTALNDGLWERGVALGNAHRRLLLQPRPESDTAEAVPGIELRYHTAAGDQGPVPIETLIDASVDLVTFDLWDTLISRTRPADAPKLATARSLWLSLGSNDPTSPWDLYQRRVEIEARMAGDDDQEYELGDVLAELVASVGADADGDRDLDRLNSNKALSARLTAEEVALERAEVRAIPELVRALHELVGRKDGPAIAIVSDFYMSAENLRTIVAGVDERLGEIQIFSSVDVGRSKRAGGALFEHVRGHFGVTADKHLHVGDNAFGDVAQQVAGGGLAVHVIEQAIEGRLGPGQLQIESQPALLAALDAELHALGWELASYESDIRRARAALAGAKSAMFAVPLVVAAIEEARRRNLSAVHYLSREGAFLAVVHRAVAKSMGEPSVAARHLEVSRRSTFGPSLGAVSVDQMKLLWSMYARQSPRAMFVSLGVDPGKFTADLERHGLELDEIVDDMTTDQRIQRLFADDRVTNRLREMLQLRRSNLVAYLGETLLVEHDQAVVVDVGWRGSIQDNLARVLPGVEFVGCYLGLFPFLNPQPANVRKRGVAFDGNLGDDFGFAEPPAAVETPWSADIASAIDYVVSDSGVRVVTAEPEEDRAADQIEVFQRALVEAVPAAIGFFNRHGLSPLHMRGPLGDRLRQYYLDPWGGVADIWFDSFHDDTFGVLNETPFKTPEPARELLWSDQPAHQIERAASSMWALGWERWLPNHSMALTRLLIDEQWALSDESDDEADDEADEEDLRQDGPAGSEV